MTDKAEIYATVKKSQTSEIHIDGGKGVGRVTKPGLACAIGEAAINPVPRKMIENAVKEICEKFNYDGGLDILIEVPQGEQIAKRTITNGSELSAGFPFSAQGHCGTDERTGSD